MVRIGRRAFPKVAPVPAPPEPTVPAGSLWRPRPLVLVRLIAGLWLFGTGEGLLVLAALGNSPWTVFADGVAQHTPLSIGEATIATSIVILLSWTRLHVRPGLGTIANALLLGVALDATLAVLDEPSGLGLRVLLVAIGIAAVGVGSGLYLGCRLGPGPRDGLMLGLHRATGRGIAPMRTAVEVCALSVGAVLGGRFGVGTVAFAVLVGPAVATALRLMPGRATGSASAAPGSPA